MTIIYFPITKKDPRNPNAPAKFYPAMRSSRRSDLRSIAQRISEMSTLTTIDSLAVLEALLTVIPQELAHGRIVELGDFGSYRLTLQGHAADTSQDLTVQHIRKAKANFVPGRLFKEALERMNYEKGAAPVETPLPAAE
jgi:predicted histone-like DNA-binding protein